jgi:hypothetical protein
MLLKNNWDDIGLGGALSENWTPMKKSDLKLHFRKLGVRDMPFQNVSMLDWPIGLAQSSRQVQYAGPLAGHQIGVFKKAGCSYLITDEAEIWRGSDDLLKIARDTKKKLVEPKWALDFIDQLLPMSGGEDQGEMLKFWLGIGLEAMLTKSFAPGQMVVLAGDSGCGKSAMQSFITEYFGGRVANPFKFLTQGKFNGALAGAEHWAIGDPDSTTDMKTRRQIGTKLKQCLVEPEFEIEFKGKDALLLPLFRRVTLTVNKEPENLAVVPPIDNSLMDKVFLFSCAPAKLGSDRIHIGKMLREQAPLLRLWLLRYYCASRLPKEWRESSEQNGRMGIRAWQHPDLFEILSGLSMEAKLLNMMDQAFFDEKSTACDRVKGKARDIEKRLRDSKQFSDVQLDKMFPHPSTCGTLLERLHRDYKERVLIEKAAKQNSGVTIWRIEPPKPENSEQEEN